MKKLYELAVRSGSYTDKDGNEKSSWLNIGSVWKNNDDNQFMLLRATFNPAAIERKNGSDCITVAMFEPKEQRSNNNTEETTAVEKNTDYSYEAIYRSIPF